MLTKSALAVILFVFCFAPAAVTTGQSRGPITGDWRIEFTRKDPDEVQLNMTRGRQNNWGNGIKISEIEGLSRDYATTSASNVTLRIVREAGTFELTGSFSNGKGSGRFTLTPNDSFFSALAARGYTNLSEDHVFSAAMSGMKLSSIDELKAAGYDQLTFDNLIESAIFKITSASIADLRSAGFDRLPFQKLVEASIFKVDSNYVREVQNLGFGKLEFQKLVELRVHKITPEYINEVRQMGFSDLNLDRLVELKIFKVTPDFVNEIRAAGFASITPQQLVSLRIFKIDGDFARKAKGANPNITVEDMVEQRIFEKRSGRD
ncbi:MAG TPA: hypothetical protein VNG71_06345 [Pyrinomonadaceae bacterium]|nr:hypothetical protein [Pyrinomonadaceae bacterium]